MILLDLLVKAFSQTKLMIIQTLILSKKEMSISDIQESIKIKYKEDYNYSSIYEPVKELVNSNVLEMRKDKHLSGQPVLVKIKNELKNDIILKYLKNNPNLFTK